MEARPVAFFQDLGYLYGRQSSHFMALAESRKQLTLPTLSSRPCTSKVWHLTAFSLCLVLMFFPLT